MVYTITFVPFALALDIGPLTVDMDPEQSFITRTITNSSAQSKVYTIKANKLTNPSSSGKAQPIENGELLYAPKQFTLQPGHKQNIKLYYKGATDTVERYYKIIFTEASAAISKPVSIHTNTQSNIEMNISLESILVVRPRELSFDYAIDNINGSIKNTGNTYFEVMVKNGCNQPDTDADSKYLLPGESYQNPKLKGDVNHKIIIFNGKFITIGNACSN